MVVGREGDGLAEVHPGLRGLPALPRGAAGGELGLRRRQSLRPRRSVRSEGQASREMFRDEVERNCR